jgi:general secretion pathway protein E
LDHAPSSRGTAPPAVAGNVRSWRAVGCERCSGTGYTDRIVISEVLDVDDEVRDLIQPNARPSVIEAAAHRKGMTSMVADGLGKCRDGLTTPEEVRRVALDI